jgi:hypothetical protein
LQRTVHRRNQQWSQKQEELRLLQHEVQGGREKEENTLYAVQARAPEEPVQGLRHGLLQARALDARVQGLRHR